MLGKVAAWCSIVTALLSIGFQVWWSFNCLKFWIRMFISKPGAMYQVIIPSNYFPLYSDCKLRGNEADRGLCFRGDMGRPPHAFNCILSPTSQVNQSLYDSQKISKSLLLKMESKVGEMGPTSKWIVCLEWPHHGHHLFVELEPILSSVHHCLHLWVLRSWTPHRPKRL